jgi:carbon monoxide dehydrogenase subunit G
MAVVEESTFVHRTPKEVFDFLARPANLPVWDNSIVDAEQIGHEAVGAGTRVKGTSKILGRRFDWVTEYAAYDPPRRLVSRSIEGRLHFTVTNTLEPEGDGTRLTWRVEATPGLGGVFGKLADPLVERAHARTVRGNLETLTEVLTEHQDVA